MRYQYSFAVNDCFLEVTRNDTQLGQIRLERQFELAHLSWVERGDDNIQLRDNAGNHIDMDIDEIPAYATIALLIAYLDGERATCIAAAAASGIPVPVAGSTSPALQYVSAPGVIAANAMAVSIANVGGANGTVLGTTLVAGASVTFEGYWDSENGVFKRLPAIAYDATGTNFQIAINV